MKSSRNGTYKHAIKRIMIIGNGTIASVLKDREDRLYFASGVADSGEKRESEYQREKDLLLAQDTSCHIVYFSTLSILYADTRYTRHKKEMESLVKNNFKLYTIMRLGNATWGNNPVHLIPFLRKKIKDNEPFEIRDVYRYPLESEDFLHWVDMIPDWSCEMNVTGARMKVKDIISKYVN